uniref:Ras homolog family member U n=1 Tax=Dromaius novaehollandiae TaxID=8790 RepID=A0A8C4K8E7_DRONO
ARASGRVRFVPPRCHRRDVPRRRGRVSPCGGDPRAAGGCARSLARPGPVFSCELRTELPAPRKMGTVVSVDGKPVRLQLCDTAGQDEFDKLRPLCYTNTDIFLLCFSVVSPSSFQNVSEKWVPEIRCHCPKAPIILVGTQSDLREDVKVLIELDKCKEKPVSEEAAKLCAEEIKAASYIECSALTQKNLKEVFDAAIVAGIQYSDTQQQPKKSKCRTPDKMKNLSKSWWKKYCCFV